MAGNALDRVRRAVRGRTARALPMAEHTTLRVGGPADLVVYPADLEDLRRVLAALAAEGVPWFPLGNGSNLVVRDGGIRGAVVCLSGGFTGLERRAGPDGSPLVWAEGGLPLRRLVGWCVQQGLSGFEPLTGIPGTVGGALSMNAGAWGATIGDRVAAVHAVAPTGELRVFDRDAMGFGYRSSELPEGHVVVGALLGGSEAPGEAVKGRARELYRRRLDTQPAREPSAGSVFKNPPGRSAGQLIDACGLKGVRVGDAEISPVHANFIVNRGMATASQVVGLMGMIQERVYIRHHLKLEPEVKVVGEWEKGKLRIQE
ncbi:MAG: UDP-N-acetylmuramate dehydrogenase [Deferrisomatales bacterium]